MTPEERELYEDFKKRFGKEFDEVYGKSIKPLSFFGFLKDDGDRIVLTDRGTYWLHALEDLFSIDYISRFWGTSKQEPWPKREHSSYFALIQLRSICFRKTLV